MKLTTPRRISRINSYLSVPLNHRINRRAAMQRTIRDEFKDVIGISKQKQFTQKQAAQELGDSGRTLRFFINEGKITPAGVEGKKREVFTREELVRFSKERELNLGPSEAYLLAKQLMGSTVNIAFGQFLAEAEKQGVIKREKKKGFGKIYFADLAKFSTRLKNILSWHTTKTLAAEIGMNEKPFLANLTLERGLLKQCLYFSGPNGGKEIRIPPKIAQIIIQRQMGLNTIQAREYLKSKGVTIPMITYFKWIKQGVIKANPERGLDNRIRIPQESLDYFIQNREEIIRQRKESKKTKMKDNWAKRTGKKARFVRKANKPPAVYDYETEKNAFIQRQQEKGMTPKMYDLLVSTYGEVFANYQRKEVPSAEAISNALWSKVGKRVPSYSIVFNFANWLNLHKWAEIIPSEVQSLEKGKK
ncbi:MAG: hypothetical protein WC746_05670 [archaeon]|jgi:hypothetical protein